MSSIKTALLHHAYAPGMLIIVACVIAFMGIITAETTYPGYSTAENTISDLGSSLPPDPVILQPAATIFNTSMMVAGALFVLAAYLLLTHGTISRAFCSVFGLFGIGILGVGIFNGSYAGMHTLFAMMTFGFGGISAMASYRIIDTPLRYPSVTLGALALCMLLFYSLFGMAGPLSKIGIGGVERWVAYPILLWACAFAGYLLSPCGQGRTP